MVSNCFSINQQVAEKLYELARLLETQGANPFQVSAYRRAADVLVQLPVDLVTLEKRRGSAGLLALPSIGRGIAAAIAEMLATGHWGQLERLRGTINPVLLFQSIPGVEPQLAQRLHDVLQVDTLEALEIAAHEGKLESVPGIGLRRAAALRATLSSMLGSLRRRRAEPRNRPAVQLLLDVDSEYRSRVNAGQVPTIAPRRFNPEGKPWLPVMHTHHGGWHFTILFSNSALAHELGRCKDWVIIYFYDHHPQEGHCTVVTESRGALMGKRVVRGRESECHRFYRPSQPTDPRLEPRHRSLDPCP